MILPTEVWFVTLPPVWSAEGKLSAKHAKVIAAWNEEDREVAGKTG